MSKLLQHLLANRQVKGSARGIYSVCSAHEWVLRAAFRQAAADDSPLLIEATCNQVNQQGGYTGMHPADFVMLVTTLAASESFPMDRVILGGDHLGPNPWQHLPPSEALPLAAEMVAEYARAGFLKLHLDASMRCAGDPSPLPDALIAERAADLCAVAEANADAERPVYVIGTEVPVPGGTTESIAELHTTRPDDAEQTLRLHREKFAERDLLAAWDRVLALVVQPGVEFNHDSVHDYDPSRTGSLTELLADHPTLVFEAHSTDYQLPRAYIELVANGFAILKVGPALTFAMREALFALAAIEDQLLPAKECSHLPQVLEETMLRKPEYWVHHYHGSAEQQRLLRTFSYSDRIRYYWAEPNVARATEILMRNLRSVQIPETLLSAYLPEAYQSCREHNTPADPHSLVLHAIGRALAPYAAACFQRAAWS